MMRRAFAVFLTALALVGCGGPTDNTTVEQKQAAQQAEQKQADEDEMQSRKESNEAAKKAKKK